MGAVELCDVAGENHLVTGAADSHVQHPRKLVAVVAAADVV
jgi:hypothetical protein